MKLVALVPALAFLLLCGCSSSSAPLFDGKMRVGPRLYWLQEVDVGAGGTSTFLVTSPKPFALAVVNETNFKAAKADDKKAFDARGIYLQVRSQGPTHEGRVTLPAGSSYFVIHNQSDQDVEMQLQCFPPK